MKAGDEKWKWKIEIFVREHPSIVLVEEQSVSWSPSSKTAGPFEKINPPSI
jgi:hypothetical protein